MKTNDRNGTAVITDVQRFCMRDGPGVRTTVFFKGCPLRCKWCHNPETQSFHPQLMFTPTACLSCGACVAVCKNAAHRLTPAREVDFSRCAACGKCATVCPSGALTISGKRVTVAELMETVKKDAAFYGEDGGLTVSGGEPTAQPEALLALLEAAKNAGISTAIETCGVFPECLVGDLCRLTELFLFDVKDTDAGRLKENTGANRETVLTNLRAIDAAGGKTALRCIVIPDVNTDEPHRRNVTELYRSLSHCLYVELLPYHPYGNAKAERIGVAKPALYRTPEKEEILAFAESLRASGVRVKCYGTEVR